MDAKLAASQPVENGSEAPRRKKGTGRVFQRPGSKFVWCQYYLRGQQVRVSTGTANLEKAEKFLRKKIGKVDNDIHEDVGRVTYESMRDALYLHYQIKKRRSLRRDKNGNLYLDKVKRLDSFFEGYCAKEITSEMLTAFVADQQKRGRADGTINRSLSALRRMFNLAKRARRLTTIPYFDMQPEADAREGFFEREEYDRLSRALPAHLRLPLALGYFTGMRLSEVLWLRWNRVHDLEHKSKSAEIRLLGSDTKNGNPRTIPVIPELRAILEQHKAEREFVCCKLDRKGYTIRIKSFRKAWYSACVKAGLGHFEPRIDRASGKPVLAPRRSPRSKPKVEMKYVGKIFHDLRRSAVRNFVRADIPEGMAQKISGHISRDVFDRYNITSEKDIADAGRKLDAYHKRMAREVCGDILGDSDAPSKADSTVIQ